MASQNKGKKITPKSTLASSTTSESVLPITPGEPKNRKSKSKSSKTSSDNSRNPESNVSATSTNNPSTHSSHPDGCRKCGKDNDHSKLLLCEMCNDEYHIYCLDPPLNHVPEDDFYCGEFFKNIHVHTFL